MKARDEGVTGIVGQMNSFPILCHPFFFDRMPQYEMLSYQQNADDPILSATRMEWFWDCYVGESPEPDPMHSPLLAKDLSRLPPACEY
jgi:acetyl esterase/lipase